MYFVTLAQNVVDGIWGSADKLQDYLKNPDEQCMYLKEVDPGEILKIINNLDIKIIWYWVISI